jgi:hypothetical protein
MPLVEPVISATLSLRLNMSSSNEFIIFLPGAELAPTARLAVADEQRTAFLPVSVLQAQS